MFLNYLKVALRSYKKNLQIFILNFLGLSVGIAAFIIILLYVDYEFSYDTFQKDYKRVYRVCWNDSFVGSAQAMGPLLKRSFPEVENITRIGRASWSEKQTVEVKGNFYYEDRFYFVDSTFFQTLDYKLLYGRPEQVLKNAFSIVITESTAQKYFNRTDAVGESIIFDGKTYLVTGIAKDVPQNSHFHFDLLATFRGTKNSMFAGLDKYWGSVNYFTYVKFSHQVDIADFHQKVIKYAKAEFEQYTNEVTFEKLYFQPLRNIHTEVIRGNLESPVNKVYLMIYVFVAIIILVVASINYTNLSIASSLNRAKEVGLRKVTGATRAKICVQFLTESVFFALLSLVFAYVLIESIIPQLNNYFEIAIGISYFDTNFLMVAFGLILWIGILSGSYPSFVISLLQPLKVLRSGYKGSKFNVAFRNVLLIIQFVISIGLITSFLIVNDQLQYIENKDIGYNRSNIVNIPLHDTKMKLNHQNIKNAFNVNANIVNVSANSFSVGDRPFHQTVWYEKDTTIDSDMAWLILADEDFLKTYEIKFVLGTTFPAECRLDPTKAYIINESAAKAYFGDENPIGKKLSMWGEKEMGRVVGVIKDFNFRSLHHPIEPLVFSLDTEYDQISLRINPLQRNAAYKFIENKWSELYPNYPYEKSEVEQKYLKMYESENKTGQLILSLTIISLIISCMGLYGINSLIAKYRIREIGVRKVFGASISQIVVSLSAGISKLVLIANIIAWPIIYFLLDNWLNNFTYRISIPLYAFILSGLITLIISVLTLSTQSVKYANTNPVETLKFE